MNRIRGKFLRKTPTVVLWLLFAVSVILFIATFTNLNDLLKKPLVRDETPQKADVVIVLGGGIVTDTKSLPWMVEERVQKAVELYKDGYALKMIVTGGEIKGHNYSESDFMGPYGISLGVSPPDMFAEGKAKDTRTNAIYSGAIMDKQSLKTALVVTSEFHTQRACHVFRKLNMDVVCVAAFKNPVYNNNYFRNLMDFRMIVREYLATVYYWLRGYV